MLSGVGHSQITINLSEGDIINGNVYRTGNMKVGDYRSLLGLLSSIWVHTSKPELTHSASANSFVPVGSIGFRVTDQGSLLDLLQFSTEILLSVDEQRLLGTLLEVTLLSGPVYGYFNILTSGQAWVAGTYSTDIILEAKGLGSISPNSQELNVIVPSFLSPSTNLGLTILKVDDLDYFRSTEGISVSQPIVVQNSVPFFPSLQGESSVFAFTSEGTINTPPVTATDLLMASLRRSGNPMGSPIILSTDNQSLSSGQIIPVPVGNSESFQTSFSITGQNLKQGFIQAGTYSLPLTYSWTPDPVIGGSLSEITTSSSLQVSVEDLSELKVGQRNIPFTYESVSDYEMGAKKISDRLEISKTTPFNLNVRASGDFVSFETDQTIPLEILKIGINGKTISLSQTDQPLIENAAPVIDRAVEIEYILDDPYLLLGKPSANFQTEIIYSLVAP